MTRSPLTAALWLWTKVGLGLVLLDLVLFRVGLLWILAPRLPALAITGWPFVYDAARLVETASGRARPSLVVGSSVVLVGVIPPVSNAVLRGQGVPVEVEKLAMFGASATDAALLAWSSHDLHPWLVIYGVALRDFGRQLERDSPAARVFYDASITLPALPREGMDEIAAAWVRRYWKLYRYQAFVRMALESAGRNTLASFAPATAAFAAEAAGPAALPPEAARWFSSDPWERITPETYALWDHWRATRRFDDYLAYLRGRRIDLGTMLLGYNRANLDPEGNVHLASLRWMLGAFARQGTRAVVAYFPENPVFRDPEAAAYFDTSLSDAYAVALAREAADHGARFLDLRNLLPAEDFHDLLHVNVEGTRRLSTRVAEIVAEEWRAR